MARIGLPSFSFSSLLLSPKTLVFPSLPSPSLSSTPSPFWPFRTLSTSSQYHHLISTTECPDGSVIFHFGDAKESEIQTQLNSSTHEEEPISFASRDAGNANISVNGKNDDDNERGDKNAVVQMMPGIATNKAEALLLDEEPTTANAGVVAPVGGDRFDNLESLAGKVGSTLEEQIAEADVQSPGNADVSTLHAEENQMTEDTKSREEISVTSFLSSGAAFLPHPSKALTGGGDAYFEDQNWLGIADGVGQWSLEGISVGLFSKELIDNCLKVVSNGKSIAPFNPVEVLSKAVVETKSPGSSTLLVACFDGQALHVANIGDSGFFIIRNDSIFKQSSPMVHEFNFPLQIESSDDPSEIVEVYKIDLDKGDVVVTATDGLFDNLYEQEIVSIVSNSLQAGLKSQVYTRKRFHQRMSILHKINLKIRVLAPKFQEIAKLLAIRAQEVGQSTSARSPFADAAQAAGFVGYTGGKLDDVTVIVSLVQNNPVSHIVNLI